MARLVAALLLPSLMSCATRSSSGTLACVVGLVAEPLTCGHCPCPPNSQVRDCPCAVVVSKSSTIGVASLMLRVMGADCIGELSRTRGPRSLVAQHSRDLEMRKGKRKGIEPF